MRMYLFVLLYLQNVLLRLKSLSVLLFQHSDFEMLQL